MPDNFRTPGIYIQESGRGGRLIKGVPTSTTVIIGSFSQGPRFSPTHFQTFRECAQTFGLWKTDNPASHVIRQFFENGGLDLWVISTGAGPSQKASSVLKGVRLLSKLESFNILMIPETMNLPDREWDNVFHTAKPLIEQHRAIYLLDPPQVDTPWPDSKTLAAWFRARPELQHPNTVLYFPRVQVQSQVSPPRKFTIPASGAMAGLLSRTDRTRGVWKAPAGVEAILKGVTGLEHALTTKDMTLLTSAGINPIRQMTPTSIVAWGARTLSPLPEWKYLSVRRTALFLEASIQKGIEWAVFESNDEPLWAQIRQSLDTFLHALFRQGAFQGTRPQDAYFVKCGRDTISPSDQTSGKVNILMGFAPLKPAEFLILNIQQKARPMP